MTYAPKTPTGASLASEKLLDSIQSAPEVKEILSLLGSEYSNLKDRKDFHDEMALAVFWKGMDYIRCPPDPKKL